MFGDPDSDEEEEEQEEEQEEQEGPKGDGLGVEEGEGVEESEEEGEGPKSSSRRAMHDFQTTAQIPKRQEVWDNFVKLYPNGYPDDKDFVAHPHYLASTRSRSGFKHVTECETYRNENWRVKFGNTIGRYFTKAKACEVAYWVAKTKTASKQFAQYDTVPEAMFD